MRASQHGRSMIVQWQGEKHELWFNQAWVQLAVTPYFLVLLGKSATVFEFGFHTISMRIMALPASQGG